MIKKFLRKYLTYGQGRVRPRYSVGVHFDDTSISYVLLKGLGHNLFLESYKTVPLEKNIVVNSKIVDMNLLTAALVELSKSFSRYTDKIVMSLPQALVTTDVFYYDLKSTESLECMAEAHIAKTFDLTEIDFDYDVIEDDDQEQELIKVFVAVAQQSDRIIMERLIVSSGLVLKYLGIESVAVTNAYSSYVNYISDQKSHDLEKLLLVICNISVNTTNVIFVKSGKLLYTHEVFGIHYLLSQMPEYANVDSRQTYDILHTDTQYDQYINAIDEVRSHLVQELSRTIRTFSDTDSSNVDQVFLTGIGAQCLDLQVMLSEIIGIDVQVLNPIEYVDGAVDKKQLRTDSFSLSPAFGLAIRGLL